MTNLELHSGLEERVDLSFKMAGPTRANFRSRSPRFWRAIIADMGAKILSTTESENVTAMALTGASLFVFDTRMVLIASGGRALDAACSLLWRCPELQLDTLVYQRRSSDESSQKEFRKSLLRLRSETGDRLGPAVVSGETVLFHPGLAVKSRVARLGARSSIQLRMRKLAWKLKGTSEERAEAVERLQLKKVFSEFTLTEHFEGVGGYSLMGVCGEEFFVLRLDTGGPAASASFEFGGRPRAEVARVIAKLCATLGPREKVVEALHKGRTLNFDCLPGCHWELQPLGQHDSHFVLCESSNSASGVSI